MNNERKTKRIAVTVIKRLGDEYVVRAFDANGRRMAEADYYTDDYDDARGTAKAMKEGRT